MSYVALATERFEESVRFYGEALGFPTVRGWDRPGARGRVFDLNGLRLEVLDATREAVPLNLPAGPAGDRVQVVVEVENAEAARAALAPGVGASDPVTTSWGARLFRVRDPDGVAVWFLEWVDEGGRIDGGVAEEER